jgi:hypothetical protein
MQAHEKVAPRSGTRHATLDLSPYTLLRREEADYILPPRLESRVRPEFPALRHNEAMPREESLKILATEIVVLLAAIVRSGDVQYGAPTRCPHRMKRARSQSIESAAKQNTPARHGQPLPRTAKKIRCQRGKKLRIRPQRWIQKRKTHFPSRRLKSRRLKNAIPQLPLRSRYQDLGKPRRSGGVFHQLFRHRLKSYQSGLF